METLNLTETFEQSLVTYTQEIGGRFIVIEHVPARVCRETGEQLFSPEIVAKIQTIVHSRLNPKSKIKTVNLRQSIGHKRFEKISPDRCGYGFDFSDPFLHQHLDAS